MATTRRVPTGGRARHDVPMRPWTVLAQDPSVLAPRGRALTTTVSIPAERLERGPKGHRVHVVDDDASTDTHYRSREKDLDRDPAPIRHELIAT